MSERIFPRERDPLDSGRRGHKARYYMACGYLRLTDHVLDVACGCGYGTEMLAERCEEALGLDNDAGTIEYAKTHHGSAAQFRITDLDKWKPEGIGCDVAVSFETVEHLKGRPEDFIEKLKTVAGRLIVFSAPIVPTKHTNPHHLHDLTEQQILNAFHAGDEWTCYEAFHHRVYGVYVFVRKGLAHML